MRLVFWLLPLGLTKSSLPFTLPLPLAVAVAVALLLARLEGLEL